MIIDYNHTKGGVCMEDKKINRAFNEMYIAAKKRLDNKSPIDIANKAGIVFCEDTCTHPALHANAGNILRRLAGKQLSDSIISHGKSPPSMNWTYYSPFHAEMEHTSGKLTRKILVLCTRQDRRTMTMPSARRIYPSSG